MFKKIRNWFINRAPIWARATLQAENATLREEIHRLEDENDRLNAYVQGLQYATRALRRITINANSAGGDKP